MYAISMVYRLFTCSPQASGLRRSWATCCCLRRSRSVMTSWTHLLFEGWGLVMVFMKGKMLSNWLQVGVWASPPPQRGRCRWEGPGTHHQPSHRDHPPVCPSRSWYVPNSSFFGGVWRGLVVIATKIFFVSFKQSVVCITCWAASTSSALVCAS